MISKDYDEFLKSKRIVVGSTGMDCDTSSIHPTLFDFQRDLVAWSIRKGRTAVFADTGLGKTRIQLEWARLIGEKTLIVAPLSVARQTVREGEKIDVQVHYVRDQSLDILSDKLFITNYEMIEVFDPDQFGAVVLDECFVSDTQIDTNIGTRPISDISIGDFVWTAFGLREVKVVTKRYKNFLALIVIQGRDIISSVNHPFFTLRGWVKAQDLQEGDYVIYTGEAVRMVQREIDRETDQAGESFLRNILFSEVEATRDTGEGAFTRSCGQEGAQEKCLVQIGQSGSQERVGTDTLAQSNGKSRIQGENAGAVEGDRTQATYTGGQRKAYTSFAGDAIGCDGRWVDWGIRAKFREKDTRLSDTLQDRYCKSGAYGCNRSRRPQPQTTKTEGTGRQKGSQIAGARVDSVAIYKSNDPIFTRYRDKTGKVALYDLQVAGHPSYSVCGLLVHNSSILKGLTGKTRQKLTEMFANTPYRLCCTATPAPNDIAEIANHAEFLGIMNRADMLATFFVHDENGWRLRGHAEEAFYRWLASWGMSVRKPSDLGYDDDGFILPPLNIEPVTVQTGYCPSDQLFFTGLKGIRNRSEVRKATAQPKVDVLAGMVNASDEQWIIWCGLNRESTAMTHAIQDATEVKGSDKLEYKIDALERFQDGRIRVMVTKPKIAGFGMNFQNCHNMAFLGLSDSWESYYQAVRRCYRFGQHHPVNVKIVLADVEQEIYHNVLRKEKRAEEMAENLIENIQQFEKAEIDGLTFEDWEYHTDTVVEDGYKLMLGDSVERMAEIPDDSVDLSVFSPPFMDLYVYSPTERDLGNSATPDDFFHHFGYIIDHLLRVTKPGRICAVHTADVPALLSKDGYIGLKDFPGKVIQAFEDRGWIYHGRVTIAKNPQAQAIRTHSKALLFVQMEKDSVWSRPAIGDYILAFRKPGDNEVPITPVENGEMTRDLWIEWASPIWLGIRETETLQYTVARGDKDDKHICPLQLETIERCIRLWSNPDEVVLDPFAGIGSTCYQAVKFGRKTIGIELKAEWFKWMVRNTREAAESQQQLSLFPMEDEWA